MPNALTHLYIFEKAINRAVTAYKGKPDPVGKFFGYLEPGMSDEDGSLKSFIRAVSAKKSELQGLVKTLFKKEIAGYATLASYGYLGSNGPDMFFIPPRMDRRNLETNKLSRLCHYNTTGGPVIYALAQLRSELTEFQPYTNEEELWMYRLAYWLGHITHIAADIVVHPFVNSRAGALKLLEKAFLNNYSRPGPIPGVWTTKPWSLHNIVEQYQDRYTLNSLFNKPGAKWREVDFPCIAAYHLRQKKGHLFIGKTIDDFYGQGYGKKQYFAWNGDKYETCRAWYWLDSATKSHMSFRNYFINVMATAEQLEDAEEEVVGAADFKAHIDEAVELCGKMLKEAIDFLLGDVNPDGVTPRERVYSVRNQFKLLSMHWNIDTGHCFKFHPSDWTVGVGENVVVACRVPVRLELKTDRCLDQGPPDRPYGGALIPYRELYRSGERFVPRPGYRFWGADVVTEGLKRLGRAVDFEIYAAPHDESDPEEVGKRIREKKYAALNLKQMTSVAKPNLGTTDKIKSSSVLALCLAKGEESTDKAVKSLCDKMLIPTVCASKVWIRKGSGRFKKRNVDESADAVPSEQLFIKFYFFRELGGGNYKCWPSKSKSRRLRSAKDVTPRTPQDVPLEPGAHNIAVVLDPKNNLKEVYLDLQKVWEAEESEEG